MRHVLIVDSVVTQVDSSFDSPEGKFHPSLKWVASPTAKLGDRYNDLTGEFSDPPPPTSAQARDAEVDAAILADETVAMLRGLTVADFDAWWAANVTTLAQANNVLKRVTRVVLRRVLQVD